MTPVSASPHRRIDNATRAGQTALVNTDVGPPAELGGHMMSTRPKVLVVGEAISVFMHYPSDPPLAFQGPFPSGAPAIFASAAARLGANVQLAAAVGTDIFGDQIHNRLRSHGVSMHGFVVDSDHPTSAAFVSYMPDGSRSFIFYLDGTAGLSVDAEALDRIGPVDWLHVSGATLSFGGLTGSTAWLAVERALDSGTRISFDPNVRAIYLPDEIKRQFSRLLDSANVVLVSAGELEAIGGSETAIVGRGATVCYKAGAAGATVVTQNGRWSVPAPVVREVDPDGAGDIFAAGYVAAALHGADPEACAQVGVAVASASVNVRGPMESTVRPVSQYLDLHGQ